MHIGNKVTVDIYNLSMTGGGGGGVCVSLNGLCAVSSFMCVCWFEFLLFFFKNGCSNDEALG